MLYAELQGPLSSPSFVKIDNNSIHDLVNHFDK